MDFNEKLTLLSQQISERKIHVKNEETTKQSLIIPFIKFLGYDIFNPLEVKPEYTADFGKKKGEKVDYAIFNSNGEALIFIEAKSISENLEKHGSQLARYFNSTPELKFAILTNGVEYHLFTDSKICNIMDDVPFLRFNILNITDEAIKILKYACKENFNSIAILEYAEELMYSKDLDASITKMLKNPSDEFIRFIIKDIVKTRITSNMITKFRPLVKKSIFNSITNIINDQNKDSIEVKPNKKQSNNKNISNKKQDKKNIINSILIEESVTIQAKEIELTSNNETTYSIKDIEIELLTDQEKKLLSIMKEILILEKCNLDFLKFKIYNNYLSVFLVKEQNCIGKLKFDDNDKFFICSLPETEVKKVTGYAFTCINVAEGVKIIIHSPKDLYNLARLIIKTFNILENNLI